MNRRDLRRERRRVAARRCVAVAVVVTFGAATACAAPRAAYRAGPSDPAGAREILDLVRRLNASEDQRQRAAWHRVDVALARCPDSRPQGARKTATFEVAVVPMIQDQY